MKSMHRLAPIIAIRSSLATSRSAKDIHFIHASLAFSFGPAPRPLGSGLGRAFHHQADAMHFDNHFVPLVETARREMDDSAVGVLL